MPITMWELAIIRRDSVRVINRRWLSGPASPP
jgi:hypothetical protein